MEARTQVGPTTRCRSLAGPARCPRTPRTEPVRAPFSQGRHSQQGQRLPGEPLGARLRLLPAQRPAGPAPASSHESRFRPDDVRRRPGRKQELYPSHSVPGMAAVLRAVGRMRPSQRRKFSSCLRAQREGRNTASISEEIIQPQLAFIRHWLGARLCAELHTDRFT